MFHQLPRNEAPRRFVVPVPSPFVKQPDAEKNTTAALSCFLSELLAEKCVSKHDVSIVKDVSTSFFEPPSVHGSSTIIKDEEQPRCTPSLKEGRDEGGCHVLIVQAAQNTRRKTHMNGKSRVKLNVRTGSSLGPRNKRSP